MDVRLVCPVFDGAQEVISDGAWFEHHSIILPMVGVAMKFVVTFPDPTSSPFAAATMYVREYENDTDVWATNAASLGKLLNAYYTIWLPGVVEMNAIPTRHYIRLFTNWGSASTNWGHVKFEAVYHVMDLEIYEHLKKTERTLEKQIEACGDQVDEHDAASLAAASKKTSLELAQGLYNQQMSDEIALYEAFFPPTL